MSTDLPKDTRGSEREVESVAAPPATDAPALSELQQAILARARETIERRDTKPRKSRSQLLVAVAVSLTLAFLAFFGINYLVAEAQRMIAEYTASKKEVPNLPPAPQSGDDPGVIIIQPDPKLGERSAPATTPPAETQAGQ